jgi:hypothetical protein
MAPFVADGGAASHASLHCARDLRFRTRRAPGALSRDHSVLLAFAIHLTYHFIDESELALQTCLHPHRPGLSRRRHWRYFGDILTSQPSLPLAHTIYARPELKHNDVFLSGQPTSYLNIPHYPASIRVHPEVRAAALGREKKFRHCSITYIHTTHIIRPSFSSEISICALRSCFTQGTH